MVENPESDSAQCFHEKPKIRITNSVTNSLAYSFKSGSLFTYQGIAVDARLYFDTYVSNISLKSVIQLNILEI